MKIIFRKLSLSFLLLPMVAIAACPNFVPGQLSASALNNAFAAPCITAGTITGSVISNSPISGNLTITGTGARILGDFSNATVANRAMFKSSTVNGATTVSALPNGTGAASTFSAESDTVNGAMTQMTTLIGSESRFTAGIRGSGTYLPMTFYTGGGEAYRVDTSKNVLVTGGGGLGYGSGSGGTVTQSTSKSTAVTLNKPVGQITMNNAALAAATTVGFTWNNSLLTGADNVIITASSGNYLVRAVSVRAGAVDIYVKNDSAGSLSDAVVLNVAVIKGVIN